MTSWMLRLLQSISYPRHKTLQRLQKCIYHRKLINVIIIKAKTNKIKKKRSNMAAVKSQCSFSEDCLSNSLATYTTFRMLDNKRSLATTMSCKSDGHVHGDPLISDNSIHFRRVDSFPRDCLVLLEVLRSNRRSTTRWVIPEVARGAVNSSVSLQTAVSWYPQFLEATIAPERVCFFKQSLLVRLHSIPNFLNSWPFEAGHFEGRRMVFVSLSLAEKLSFVSERFRSASSFLVMISLSFVNPHSLPSFPNTRFRT